MPDLADHAFAHLCAVLGPVEEPTEAAIYAVRRGGRSRSAVLGHARHAALARVGDAEVTELDQAVPGDLTELAAALARTRPPIERVIVDLSTRHGLDRGGFARALGLPPAAAGARAAAVYLDWQFILDPMVLAHLGAGDCDDLASVLAGRTNPEIEIPEGAGPEGAPSGSALTTLRDLVALGPEVAGHAAACPPCGDRLRSMVSVRTLVGQRPLESAPAAVRAASTASRLRLSVPAPALEPAGAGESRLRPALAVGLAGLLAVGVATVVSTTRREPPRSVEALTQVPAAGSALRVSPSSVEGPVPPRVTLENASPRDVRWEAMSDSAWLVVSPEGGLLGAGDRARLRLSISPGAPEGDVRGSVRIQGAEGSVTVVRLVTTVERPPDVAASRDDCVVSASVEDEGQVGAVELHLADTSLAGRGPEAVSPMEATSAGYVGLLPNVTTPLTWWVTAVDARGNASRSPDQAVPANTCP